MYEQSIIAYWKERAEKAEEQSAYVPNYSEIEHASAELSKALHSLTESEEREAVFSIQRLFRERNKRGP